MINFATQKNPNKQAMIVLLPENSLKRNTNIHQKILQHIIMAKRFSAKSGEIFPVLEGKKLFLFAGLGKSNKITATQLRLIVKKALESDYLKGLKTIEIMPPDHKEKTIIAIIEGAKLGTYRWDKYITSDSSQTKGDREITVISKEKRGYVQASHICDGVNFARDLVNDNADYVTSELFETLVSEIVQKHPETRMEILGRQELVSKGLNLHLAVNQGSRKEPKLIIIKYTGNTRSRKYTAIIGKGITFDSGGLNLKPSGYIESMRQDMGGAAAVLGVLKNVCRLNLKKNVIFALGIAENAIGSGAYKPGEVLTSYSKKTVEIANTDAEGRLVLADAIAYVEKNYKPERIIDIATLTGACVVALGYDYTGLVSTDDQTAQDLLACAEKTDDRTWRLPCYAELKDALKSKIADIKNLGLPKGAAGTLTAAEFLRQFANKTKWAHLDIAGTGFVDAGQRLYFGAGATGAGVRLLTCYIKDCL